MILFCAAGHKIPLTDIGQPRNELILWREGGQVLIESGYREEMEQPAWR